MTAADDLYRCDDCEGAFPEADLSAGDDGRHRCPACAAGEAAAGANRVGRDRTGRRRAGGGGHLPARRAGRGGGAALLLVGVPALLAAGAVAYYFADSAGWLPTPSGDPTSPAVAASDGAASDGAGSADRSDPIADPAQAARAGGAATFESVAADLSARIDSARRLLRDRQPAAARDALASAQRLAAEHAALSPTFADRADSLAASIAVLDRKLGRKPARAAPAPIPPATARADAPASTPAGAKPPAPPSSTGESLSKFDDELSFFKSDTP